VAACCCGPAGGRPAGDGATASDQEPVTGIRMSRPRRSSVLPGDEPRGGTPGVHRPRETHRANEAAERPLGQVKRRPAVRAGCRPLPPGNDEGTVREHQPDVPRRETWQVQQYLDPLCRFDHVHGRHAVPGRALRTLFIEHRMEQDVIFQRRRLLLQARFGPLTGGVRHSSRIVARRAAPRLPFRAPPALGTRRSSPITPDPQE
jgi:hypothetical protein